MSKLFTVFLVVFYTSINIIPVSFALDISNSKKSTGDSSTIQNLVYPDGTDFVQLKSIIDNNFTLLDTPQRYRSNCIYSGRLCSNYRYTRVIEKAIKLIVLKTYRGNEDFYATIFNKSNDYTSKNTPKEGVQSILEGIPPGAYVGNLMGIEFGQSLAGDLLDASFGVNFNENSNSSSMLRAIEGKVNDIKRTKCQRGRGDDCYSRELSNIYLPTQEELYNETIFLNGKSVKIESLKDEIEYTLHLGTPINQTDSSILEGMDRRAEYRGYMNGNIFILTQDITLSEARKNCNINTLANPSSTVRCTWDNSDISNSYPLNISIPNVLGYTLKYLKDSYTLEEAQNLLMKNDSISNDPLVFSSSKGGAQLPCKESSDYATRVTCTAAISINRDVITALGAYYADRETYPDTIEKLDKNYMPKGRGDFDKYFTYNQIVNADNSADYEIKYIGKIGQNLKSSDTVLSGSSMKRDYRALMSGSTVPEIPTIFAHIPSDSMVLYVRNPAGLLDILNQKSNTTQKISGLDVSENIRGFIKTFFEIDNFEKLEENLKHDVAIVVNNLDATAPDIVIALSELDKGLLPPSTKTHFVGNKDGFVFLANSQESLDRFMSLDNQKSMKNAPDFQYVWWKKSAQVKDVLIYVGDEFFAKMLTFEEYLTHYRKYRDYSRLNSLQELVWSYGDAFGRSPTDFTELVGLGLSTLTGETLGEYSIEDGIVKHQHIGTLKSLRTIPEAGYNLSEISRSEIEDYKYSVLKYRDIWRSSLDPMGIVLNRYGDGFEIDFFMTPIPDLPNRDFQVLLSFFEGITKDSFSFVTNPNIRMGLISGVWGFDPQKIQNKALDTDGVGTSLEEFNREVLGGKNIFDYIAGEFALSLGDIDPDLLDGWNVEKIDVYGSVQVTSEEKGKELIEIIRSRILKEVGSERGDEAEMIKGFLARPLIEDYNGKKIYYVEGLPIPFVGKIGFAYTFVDDFFIIGLNRSTIKKVIDTAKTGDKNKVKILDNSSFSSGTFFAMMVDGVTMSERIRSLYEKNKSSIPRYMKYLELADLSGDSNIDSLMGAYYSTQDRNKRLGIQTKPFSYTLGTLQITGDAEKVMVKVDAGGIKSLSGVTLQMWNNIESEANFSQSILSNVGISLAEFLVLPYVEDIISLNVIAHLDQMTSGTELLFRNMTFGLNIGDDEIGFKFGVFREMDHPKNSNSLTGTSKEILVISLFAVILGIVGGVGFVVYKRKQSQVLSSVSIYTAPIMSPQTSVIVDNPPNIISSIIHTPITETSLDSNSTTIPPTGATQNQ